MKRVAILLLTALSICAVLVVAHINPRGHPGPAGDTRTRGGGFAE